MPYIRTARGNGQGQCTACKREGKYSWTWMCFLYEVDGREGYYCAEHAKIFKDVAESVKGGIHAETR